ncbi:hypothetical protein PHYPSEUDO_004974 [Phytophthora pseudosyringae]|uniref:Uncharacterized protein n=1 Tax=Phytophthora pseudosyringae TaxID=221518 RepID=A0A8T1WID9_9STRA|nr:hypothetical protein PHYPSEUDO_004974 [Phytophthora pseudosyringae]
MWDFWAQDSRVHREFPVKEPSCWCLGNGSRGVAEHGIFHLTCVIRCACPFCYRLAWVASEGQNCSNRAAPGRGGKENRQSDLVGEHHIRQRGASGLKAQYSFPEPRLAVVQACTRSFELKDAALKSLSVEGDAEAAAIAHKPFLPCQLEQFLTRRLLLVF